MTDQSIVEQTFVAFDLETTGIQAAIHRIVEIGAVKFNWQDGLIGTYETLVDPERPIPDEVIAVHGITDDMVKGHPLIQDCLGDFLKFIDGSVLLAHNAPFDLGFLSYSLNSFGINKPDNLVIDTCSLARSLISNTPNFKLQTLVKVLKLENLQAHRAVSDSIACSEVFKACVKNLPKGEFSSLEELFETTPQSRSAFFGPQQPEEELKPLTIVISHAISKQEDIVIEYHNAKNEKLPRKITPIYLGGYGKHIYLEAFCHLRQARRHFRLDRIQQIQAEKQLH